MGTSATPKSPDDSKVNAAVIGVGVGLAAGFAAPLLAGVALSAAGFTSTGIAAGSLAASWRESGGSFFRALQSAAEGGLSGTVAAGLGAALGTAAAVVTFFVKGNKPQPTKTESEDKNENLKSTEKSEPACEAIENVTSQRIVLSEVEAEPQTKLKNFNVTDIKPTGKREVHDEDAAAAVEEQAVHVAFVPNQKSSDKEISVEHIVKQIVTQETVEVPEEVLVEAVVKLGSAFQPEKCEIDEAKTEKAETPLWEGVESTQDEILPQNETIIATATATSEEKSLLTIDDVVHHASTKPEEEADLLKEAVEQLVEIEAVSEELAGIEVCVDRDDGRHVSEEIEILTASGISSPVINNSVTNSLFQELTDEDVHGASEMNDTLTTSTFQELNLEDARVDPSVKTVCNVLECKHPEEQEAEHIEAVGETIKETVLTSKSEGSEATGGSTSTIQHVADRLINEIESVLSGSGTELPAFETNLEEEPEKRLKKDLTAANKLAIDSPKNEMQLQAVEWNIVAGEPKDDKVETAPEPKAKGDEEESGESEYSDEAYEEDNSDEEEEAAEDKDKESEKELKTVAVDAPVQTQSKASEQTHVAITETKPTSDQSIDGKELGEFRGS